MSASTLCDSQRTNICSHTLATEAKSAGARASSDISPVSVWLVAPVISTGTISPGDGEAVEVDDLVVAGAAADAAGVGARRALDEHVERAADEPLRALARAALDDLDEALHPLDGDLVRDEVVGDRRPPRCRGAASR